MGGRVTVSFYAAAARAWRAPTFSWHAAPHQPCNKSIFILTPAPPTSPPPDPFPSLLYSHMTSSVQPSSLHCCGSQLWMGARGGWSHINHLPFQHSSLCSNEAGGCFCERLKRVSTLPKVQGFCYKKILVTMAKENQREKTCMSNVNKHTSLYISHKLASNNRWRCVCLWGQFSHCLKSTVTGNPSSLLFFPLCRREWVPWVPTVLHAWCAFLSSHYLGSFYTYLS